MQLANRDTNFRREAVEIELHSLVSEDNVIGVSQTLAASYFGGEQRIFTEIEVGKSVRGDEIEIR